MTPINASQCMGQLAIPRHTDFP